MLVIRYNSGVGFGSGIESSKKSSVGQDTFHTKPYHSLATWIAFSVACYTGSDMRSGDETSVISYTGVT